MSSQLIPHLLVIRDGEIIYNNLYSTSQELIPDLVRALRERDIYCWEADLSELEGILDLTDDEDRITGIRELLEIENIDIYVSSLMAPQTVTVGAASPGSL